MVYDQTQRRLTVFDPQGHHVRDVSLNQREQNFFPIIGGRFPDGTYVGALRLRRQSEELPTGLVRDSLLVLRFTVAGGLLDTVGIFHNRLMDVQTRSIGSNSFRGPAEVAFSPRSVWTITADRLVVGTSDSYEIRAFRKDGTPDWIVRKYHEPIPVTDGDREQLVQTWRDIWYDRLDNPEIQYVLHTLEESPLPETFPAFDPQVLDDRGWRIGESLLTDPEENLWVAEYRPPGSGMSPRRTVFNVSGEWLGEITLPDGFTLMDVGSDHLIGLWSDDLGVESIRLHDVNKPGITDRSGD